MDKVMVYVEYSRQLHLFFPQDQYHLHPYFKTGIFIYIFLDKNRLKIHISNFSKGRVFYQEDKRCTL